MKNNILSLLAAGLLLTTTACTIDIREADDLSTSTSTGSTTASVLDGSGTLSGNINKDLLIIVGNYTLSGVV
jgi:outer membrane lipopolysaccharide assembly protein LptE/RlpB